MDCKIGDTLNGSVTGIQPYGAFVSLDDATQGLIHVSEVQSGYTKNIQDVLTVGEKVRVQVIDIDEYSQKVSLSRRTLEEQFPHPGVRKKRYFTNKHKKIGFSTIREALPHWTNEALSLLIDEKRKIQ
ncbi:MULTISPECIES: CvfD/Ygs/GSP13 family RNA-binding post-transcriptional regulator [Enterococcus]|uniref:General stress protein 13 n=1 Tax=Enterococcus alcedinis TaxID=1274384 RepID=A0A917JFQ0_9ENTE|nr:CvfD/Ygs/GSP13 family RNA-binding post-transcriptional regulator [Enterococcus alcedinis]MBP2102838.1 general stress protein 13 [Enterococcus alcedinis]GGI66400.1 general stress protein 13 [Enterococcus alcedinis]